MVQSLSSAPHGQVLATPSGTDLLQIEIDAIDVFVRIAQFVGAPKSVGEIFGLLFISSMPVSGEEIRAKLRISSGSASQGLNLLRRVGAARPVYLPGDRRDYYVAETGLQKIAAGFLRERIAPHLADQEERIAHLAGGVAAEPTPRRLLLEERVRILQGWRKQARAMFPLLLLALDDLNDHGTEAASPSGCPPTEPDSAYHPTANHESTDSLA